MTATLSDQTAACAANLSAPNFQLQQAVHTRFWGDNVGRIASISLAASGRYWYEVETIDGKIVLEHELYLKAAPRYESALPMCALRPSLTPREIDARWDTPEENNDDRPRPFCWWGGVNFDDSVLG